MFVELPSQIFSKKAQNGSCTGEYICHTFEHGNGAACKLFACKLIGSHLLLRSLHASGSRLACAVLASSRSHVNHVRHHVETFQDCLRN